MRTTTLLNSLSLVAVLALCRPAASAVVFTNDTLISFNNAAFDGLEIAISNCTVTIDGAHAFADVRVLSGGVLTHSSSSNGVLLLTLDATAEPHSLSFTNPATLNQTNVLPATIVVQDVTGTITYTQNVDYQVIASPPFTLLARPTNSAIAEGATILVNYSYLVPIPTGLKLAVSNNFVVDVDGAVLALGTGFGPGAGPGGGGYAITNYPYPYIAGAGGAHAGFGGASASQAAGGAGYDSAIAPAAHGSGGGRGSGLGGWGGGSVDVNAGGLIQIDGHIAVDGLPGTNANSGGGAGGSIWLTASTFAGAGVLSANGGNGEPTTGGGGGGGRVAISASTNLFTGTMSAVGGLGAITGGAGSIFIAGSTPGTGFVTVDNGGASGTNTLLGASGPFDLSVRGGAVVAAIDSSPITLASITVASNSALTHLPGESAALLLTVSGDATFFPGSAINLDGKGYGGGQGLGAGATYQGRAGGGGGFGGFGGAGSPLGSGGTTYGLATAANDTSRGSGGGDGVGTAPTELGGAGGGNGRLTIGGNLVLNGRISANGISGLGEGCGGGSGGYLSITAGRLSGAGSVLADGGAGVLPAGGGGGGGRIVVFASTNEFAGTLEAKGGSGAHAGGAGTVYTQTNGSLFGQLIIDNGGQSGTNTPLPTVGQFSLTIRGGAFAVGNQTEGLSISNFFIGSNSWVSGSVNLSVGGDAFIETGGGIILDGLGYGGGLGLGAGRSVFSSTIGYTAGGAGYGGFGGSSMFGAIGGNSYGSMPFSPGFNPPPVGSGGGSGNGTLTNNLGGAGGGAVQLNVAQSLTVNGIISANGTTGPGQYSGGGSGGGLALSAARIAGNGTIRANGGLGDPPYGGGGAGGRIQIIAATNQFAGQVSAYGGAGANYGAAGTIYIARSLNVTPTIIIDNGGGSGTNTPLSLNQNQADLTIRGGAVALIQNLANLNSLFIGSNSWLTYTSPFSPRTLLVLNSATLQSGGGINLDAQGQPQGPGMGSTLSLTGGGGGYGGFGGRSATNAGGGFSYGSLISPTDLGSGGGSGTGSPSSLGGMGGGAFHFMVNGVLTNDGRISANGGNGIGQNSGGGSGGSLWLTVGRLVGSGQITANGGAADLPLGGGGGGGRISITITTNLVSSNTFSGIISARGGAGAMFGGAGSIFLQFPKLGQDQGSVMLDNGGNRGALSGLAVPFADDLIVTGGAQLLLTNPTTLNSLLIASNSFLTYTSPVSPRTLTVNSNATIQAGGAIVLDGLGSPRQQGEGPGSTANALGGGGGHGGYGGRSGVQLLGSTTTQAAGGLPYGTINAPNELGSGGGGNSIYQTGIGGAGGGALRLAVGGVLQIDGRLSADGNSAASQGGGGGSGGSLFLSAARLQGAGVISANGGPGALPLGGGGSGGRIAAYYTSNLFTGTIMARGGAGANYGASGTTYLKASNSLNAIVIVDNGGALATNTPVTAPGTVDLTIGGGATVTAERLALGNLLVQSNGWIITVSSPLSITIASNATIRAGGGIVADGSTSVQLQNPGAGGIFNSPVYGTSGGGGGYGGYGGSSTLGAPGGNSYDSYTSPVAGGSRGGNGNGLALNNNIGGPGGSAVQLNVKGTLTLDGLISANGSPGIGQWSGGGSGGAVWLTVGTIAGAGQVSANGGPGDPPYGGSGGGGRIAIYSTTNIFQGRLVAYGAPGPNPGGAGTIYLNSKLQTTPSLIIDNGGSSGTNTPVTAGGSLDLSIRGGAKANPTMDMELHNLTVEAGSWLNQLPGSNKVLTLTVLNQVSLSPGGGINFSGASPGSAGNGGIAFLPAFGCASGGGGYGGYGGTSIGGAVGGGSYGSIVQPTDLGSSGGIGCTSPAPNAPVRGGSALHLIVASSLQNDGLIAADGADAPFEGAGGGSGGSLWITAGRLAGSGTISADGGNGDGIFGGGGGGGRIALYPGSSSFTGSIHAYGGLGAETGGAGTIYTITNGQGLASLVIDNGGTSGTNTPITTPQPFDLKVLGGAVASPASNGTLIVNSLLLDTGAGFAQAAGQTNLDLVALHAVTIGPNAFITANGSGYGGLLAGPGVGQITTNGSGSGAGYGGVGGMSASGAPGGVTYGSAVHPSDLGSRGGFNLASATNASFSAGGGDVRLRVGDTLSLNGRIAANGNDAVVDGAGGGSGGSIWITARTLSGQGFIVANGGSGEPPNGGGGGGGRIAVYVRTNAFNGPIGAYGGFGYMFGGNGTVVLTNIPAPQVIAQSPSDIIEYAVSTVDLTFDSLIDPSTLTNTQALVDGPNGLLPEDTLTLTALDVSRLRVAFPAQNTIGYYEVQAGPAIQDIYGQPMEAPYVGSFVILPPTVSGTVSDIHGTPVRFVTISPSGLPPTVTDVNGHYEVEVTPSWSGTITPTRTSATFLPVSRTYNTVSLDLTNQNYLLVTPSMMTLAQTCQDGCMQLHWFGMNGVSYQILYSIDLINWLPYQAPIDGTNGPIMFAVPVETTANKFFRFSACCANTNSLPNQLHPLHDQVPLTSPLAQ